jgi:predicted CDP-diglyceride synthetase/phosphatidate cytidylyltransferase
MGLGGCIILIAVGAVLTFATDWHMNGVNLDLVGVILMIVGLIGVTTFSSIARRRRVMVPPTTTVVEEERHHHHHTGDGYSDGYGL